MRETYRLISNHTSERQAQLLLDEPEKSIERMLEYEEMLQDNLGLMGVHRPDKYREKLVRHMRKPILAALTSLYYTEVVKDVLPKLEQDTLEISTKTELRGYFREYSGATARFADTMRSHMRPCFDKKRTQLENPKDEYHNLWLCYDAVVDMYRFNGLQNFQATRERVVSLDGILDEAINTTLDLLIQMGRQAIPLSQLAESQGTEPQKLADEAVRNADLGVQLAGTNNRLTQALIHSNPASLHFEKYESTTLHDEQAFMAERPQLFTRDSHGLAFRHPSLQNQTWPVEGFCPATPTLRPSDPEDRQAVERFFYFFENRYQCEVNRTRNEHGEGIGAFDRATVVMLLGAYVAGQTLFRAWPRLVPSNYSA